MENLFTIESGDASRTIAAATAESAVRFLATDELGEFEGITEANITARETVPGWSEFFSAYHPLDWDTGKPVGSERGKASIVGDDRFGLKPGNIWTLIQDDVDGLLWIVPGTRFANRLGYILTGLPAKDESEQYLF